MVYAEKRLNVPGLAASGRPRRLGVQSVWTRRVQAQVKE